MAKYLFPHFDALLKSLKFEQRRRNLFSGGSSVLGTRPAAILKLIN